MRFQNNFGPILSSNSSQSEFEVENEKKRDERLREIETQPWISTKVFARKISRTWLKLFAVCWLHYKS